MDVVLNKLVNLDLDGKTITGSVSMTSGESGTINIENGTITKDLTIDTASATVNVGSDITVSGATNITAVNHSSFVSAGKHIGGININGQGRFELSGTASSSPVVVNTDAKVLLEGDIDDVTLIQTADLTVNTNNSVAITVPNANNVVGLKINKPVTIISTGSVKATIDNGVEVTVKDTVESSGLIVTGTGEIVEDIKEVAEGKRLLGVAEGLEAEKLGFKSTRLLATKASGTGSSQVITNKIYLEMLFNKSNAKETIIQEQTKKHNDSETRNEKAIVIDANGNSVDHRKLTAIPENLVIKENGLKIGLSIDGNDLILGETTMTKELFEAIKVQPDSEYEEYFITVTKGFNKRSSSEAKDAIAKIQFTLEDDQVLVKLVDASTKGTSK